MISEIYEDFKECLEKNEFIIIIGKYDQILGPRSLYSSYPMPYEDFVRNLLRDALNTRNKFVLIDYVNFYSQVCKVDIEDETARGKKQLYAIILLREKISPQIPTLLLLKMEMLFHKISKEQILNDDAESFREFFEEINNIFKTKEEILPIEEFQIELRSGINTIQGFCELLLEMIEGEDPSKDQIKTYVNMMLASSKEITSAMEKQFGKAD